MDFEALMQSPLQDSNSQSQATHMLSAQRTATATASPAQKQGMCKFKLKIDFLKIKDTLEGVYVSSDSEGYEKVVGASAFSNLFRASKKRKTPDQLSKNLCDSVYKSNKLFTYGWVRLQNLSLKTLRQVKTRIAMIDTVLSNFEIDASGVVYQFNYLCLRDPKSLYRDYIDALMPQGEEKSVSSPYAQDVYSYCVPVIISRLQDSNHNSQVRHWLIAASDTAPLQAAASVPAAHVQETRSASTDDHSPAKTGVNGDDKSDWKQKLNNFIQSNKTQKTNTENNNANTNTQFKTNTTSIKEQKSAPQYLPNSPLVQGSAPKAITTSSAKPVISPASTTAQGVDKLKNLHMLFNNNNNAKKQGGMKDIYGERHASEDQKNLSAHLKKKDESIKRDMNLRYMNSQF